MEPLYPAHVTHPADTAHEVVAVSSRLEARLAPPTLEGVAHPLLFVNRELQVTSCGTSVAGWHAVVTNTVGISPKRMHRTKVT